MDILVIGEEKNFNECREKFGPANTYTLLTEHHDCEQHLDRKDLVFDFIIHDNPESINIYAQKPVCIFFNTTMITLGELVSKTRETMKCTIFGFNGLPTFVTNPVLETCIWQQEDQKTLARICADLNTGFLVVDDRVGLVTPRVVCMIINEAYYTVQEGTASRDAIDKAMKLGTNYPYGPFEWCERIGVKHVYTLLEALYEETKDERYKICALLKKDYLKS